MCWVCGGLVGMVDECGGWWGWLWWVMVVVVVGGGGGCGWVAGMGVGVVGIDWVWWVVHECMW